MIKLALGAIALALSIAFPAAAQSFSHTHGEQGHHSHDTTIHNVSGDCCCMTTHRTHAPKQVRRTYTKTYVHPKVERRVYTRTVPNERTHRRVKTRGHGHGHGHGHKQHRSTHTSTKTPALSYDEQRDRDYALAGERHNDRAQAWAHYDRRWRSRTNDKRR
ncbi:MAG: hypothetical protein ABJH52_06640 [Henriciella sp.]